MVIVAFLPNNPFGSATARHSHWMLCFHGKNRLRRQKYGCIHGRHRKPKRNILDLFMEIVGEPFVFATQAPNDPFWAFRRSLRFSFGIPVLADVQVQSWDETKYNLFQTPNKKNIKCFATWETQKKWRMAIQVSDAGQMMKALLLGASTVCLDTMVQRCEENRKSQTAECLTDLQIIIC